MFSSIFGKRRSSPTGDEIPPIPGPRPDDSFVVVNPSPMGGLYPSVGGLPGPGQSSYYRPAPAPPPPAQPRVTQPDHTFHYLQGVPFVMCRELQMASNKDAVTTEVVDLLAFLTNKMSVSNYNYDFSMEKSVLKDC